MAEYGDRGRGQNRDGSRSDGSRGGAQRGGGERSGSGYSRGAYGASRSGSGGGSRSGGAGGYQGGPRRSPDAQGERQSRSWDGDSRPRRDGDSSQRRDATSGSTRQYGDSRPQREGGYAPRRDGDSRPRRDGDSSQRRDATSGSTRQYGDSRPQREGGYAPRRDGDSRPRRDGDSRPQRDGGYAPRRDGDSRPRRDGDSRPQREGGYAPRRDSGFGRRDDGGDRRGATQGSRGGSDRPKAFGERGERRERPASAAPKVEAPPIPDDITASMLDKDARGRLRTLSKDNADDVARHLVMAGQLMDRDPELAYRHAATAAARAGRVDMVREAAAIAAYVTGRYAEALREFRTVQRLNGSPEHLALIADCERGLGRPERALEVAASADLTRLAKPLQVELQIVVAGARSDMGQYDAALLVLDRIKTTSAEQAERVAQARIEIGARAGRNAHAAPPADDEWEDDVVVYDLETEDSDG